MTNRFMGKNLPIDYSLDVLDLKNEEANKAIIEKRIRSKGCMAKARPDDVDPLETVEPRKKQV